MKPMNGQRWKYYGTFELPLALLDGLFTFQEAIEEHILPHSKTEEDTLKIVKRLEARLDPPQNV